MAAPRSWLGLAVIMAAFLSSTACGGDPPNKELQEAQAAITAAETAGADQYAHEEFSAARDALARAHAAVTERDYRLALNHALDSRDRAQHATKDATDQRIAARAAADHTLTTTSTALAELKVKLKAAERAHAASRLLTTARRAVTDGEQHLQKARAAFGAGQYRDVGTSLNDVTARFAGTERDLDAAVPASSRRRR